MDRLTSFCDVAHVVSKFWFLKKGGGRVMNKSLKLNIKIGLGRVLNNQSHYEEDLRKVKVRQ
jgi:hypothetical protein